jgi:hypothetical protein
LLLLELEKQAQPQVSSNFVDQILSAKALACSNLISHILSAKGSSSNST